MPRPDLSARRSSTATVTKSTNPLVNWLAMRKERRLHAEEEASKLITNKIAENENTIIDQLRSVDFLHSKLPKAVLEVKTRPDQPYGDLEFAVHGIIHTLLKNPQTVKMDIRKIDTKILALVLMFKEAVEKGDVRAAYAAKGALIRGINDIRGRIPQNQPELAKQFVVVNTRYLDQWITLVGLAQVADRTKQNVESQRLEYQQAEVKQKEKLEALEKRLQDDPEYTSAFYYIQAHDTPEERSKWSAMQREVHRTMVEQRMENMNLQLSRELLQQQEIDLSTKVSQVDLLYTKVQQIPIPCDPDLMNKFRESVDELFEQLAASDAEIDETLKTLDDIEGRINQLNHAPGAVRAREVAAEEAEKALEAIRKKQENVAGQNAVRARKMREEMGIYSEEQLAQMRKEAEAIEQAALEEMKQAMGLANEDQEGQQNYN